MRAWTAQQKAAIDSPSRKIVCSAAAGSGKTAVMIERIVRMLREGADPESFLIVTFTNAAAAEMKQKIRERLVEGRAEKTLRRALDKIDLMEISTIHSFCQHLIRQEFQAAKTDPMFAVCEPARSKQLFTEAFRSACTELQEAQDPDYIRWKQCFSVDNTEDIVRAVHSFMMSLPDPLEWLERSCDNVPLTVDRNHPWFETAAELVKDKLRSAQVILNLQFRMFDEEIHGEPYRATWKADRELFHVKQLWAEGEDVPPEQLNAGFTRLAAWSKLNPLEEDWKARYCEYREQLKEILKEIESLLRPDENTVQKEFGNMRESLQGLKKITRLTSQAFREQKAALRVLDFNDFEHFALELLRDETVRASVQDRYREIFVDECQDVSKVQDALIQLLASPEGHLFMVGDVKQSIYRFRLADPGLFLDHIQQCEDPDSGWELLELQTNFRSRPEILETANTVFRDVMKAETAELDYTEREELLPGKKVEPGFHPVYADVLQEDPERTKMELYADYLAARASELLAQGYRYKDIVILMPQVSRDGQKFADELEKRGVPVFFDGGTDFYERLEVSSFVQLLTCVDNPFLDEPLLSVLKNAPFFFSDEELAEVRLCRDGKNVSFRDAFDACIKAGEGALSERCREADEKVRHWRELSFVMRMSPFVRFLCSESQIYAMAGAGPMGRNAQRNLDVFCRKAEEAENGGVYSLRRFLSYVSEQAGGGDQSSAASLAENDDVVRIMTMHKSKGLQFPVVFCMGLDNRVTHNMTSGVMLDAKLGICLKYKRPEYRISRSTAAEKIFRWKKEKEERAERIRLLYVAMTRAQERMFLAGAGEDRTFWQTPAGAHRVLAASDYLDWILPALKDAEKISTNCAQASTPWEIRVLEINQQEIVENRESYPQSGEWLDSLLFVPPVEGLWKHDEEKPVSSRMKKRSVTSLLEKAGQELGAEGEEETPEDKRIPERFSEALKRAELVKQPAFMDPPKEKKGAWRGSVIHRFLSLADLDRVRAAGADLVSVLGQIKQEMLDDEIFTEEEGAVIRPEDAAAFWTSELGRRMLAGSEIHREWSFNLFRAERNLLVQGVIDCAFREGDGWIVVDYKTDRIEDEAAFVDSYSPQLAWYAVALRILTGIPVLETWLWSISKTKAFRVDVGNGPPPEFTSEK